jgi:hypothetical protein
MPQFDRRHDTLDARDTVTKLYFIAAEYLVRRRLIVR